MAGKFDLPGDADTRPAPKSGDDVSPELSALDRERAASLADEGGAAAATGEAPDLETLHRIASALPVARLEPDALPGVAPAAGTRTGGTAAAVAAVVAAGVVGAALLRKNR